MHIESNIFANILKHLFGDKDTVASRKDMEDVNCMSNLWIHREEILNFTWSLKFHIVFGG